MILTKSVTAMRPPVDALIPRHAERGFHAGRAVRSPVPGDEYAQCEQSRKLRISVTRIENGPAPFLNMAWFLL